MTLIDVLLQATVEVLATRCECPFIFCEKSNSGEWVSSRYWKRLRFTLMEFYEHSETCSDRREHALEVLVNKTFQSSISSISNLGLKCEL